MYYNIKIKSNGSEFSLESENKEVTQREMDLYFACIFDVSEEFKSKIKKVEVNNSKVVSINMIETMSEPSIQNIKKEEQSSIKQETPIIKEINSKPITQTPTQIKESTLTTQQPISIDKTIQTFNNQIEESTQTPTSINIINTQTPTTITQTIQPIIQEIVEQTIQIAQQYTNSQNTPSNKELYKKNFETQIANAIANNIAPTINSSIDIENNNTIPNIEEINNTQDFETQIKSMTDNQNTNSQTQEAEDEIQNPENNDINELINLAQKQLGLEDKNKETEYNNQLDNNKNINLELNTDTPPSINLIDNDVIPQISLAEIENSLNINNNNEDIPFLKEDIKKQEETPVEKTQLDFVNFLKGFKCDDLSEIFLICAFYIKNILRQECFSIKYINSKIFQATGKIADTSIVDELTNKEYIKIIETSESRKYCITQDGESYFATKFQG